MKVLLLGNYPYAYQQSMQRFADLLLNNLGRAGVNARLLRPPPVLGRIFPSESGFGKWLGYLDRFVLFRLELRRHLDWADVVHICDHSNAIYVPWLKDKPHVVTCHDILAVHSALGLMPEYRPRWSGRMQQRWILRNLCQVRSIVCVSEQTFKDVCNIRGISKELVTVVPNALNYPYHPMAPSEASNRLSNLGIDPKQPFLLHVGGNQWYKNRSGVLHIFHHLLAHPQFSDHHLVMMGKPFTRELTSVLKQNGIAERTHQLTSVSNENLRALYSSARALIFPSLYEGFGWPVLEAQACGCPVFTSGRAPMTEVGGRAARYFDPTNTRLAADTIALGLNNVEGMRKNGLENAKRFSLDSMIAGYIAAYRQAR